MTTTRELMQHGKKAEIWTKLCGYLDLNSREFMEIQERLLLEQIEYLKKSEIGKHLLGNKVPTSVEEFCNTVPLTRYSDYHPFFKDQNPDVLPSPPFVWARTSGRSGEYPWKWAPYTKAMYDQLGEGSLTAIICSALTRKGEVLIDPKNVLLLGTAPPPYMSGYLSLSVEEQSGFRFVPPLEEGVKMEFGERIATGFKTGMVTGLDYFYGLASILAKMGERFESGSNSMKISPAMLRPDVFFRLLKGYLLAKLSKRKLLPKDIWKLKGVLTGGTDTDVYRDRIKYYWGQEPLEGYASTETGILAFQTWTFDGMTFMPYGNFLEFIPFEEHIKSKQDALYKPKTVVFGELRLGIYELVVTNLMGGVFTRYRIGDLVEVIAMKDEKAGIDLPQVRFYSRGDDIIDLAGMVRFTERTIWQVIEASNMDYVDWTARKEDDGGMPILHIYIELKPGDVTTDAEMDRLLRESFRKVTIEFADLENLLGKEHLKVSRIPDGAFANYIEEQRRNGSDLAHIKPNHMQAKDKVIARLMA